MRNLYIYNACIYIYSTITHALRLRAHVQFFVKRALDLLWWMINPLECFFTIEGHIALDRNLGLGYNTLLLWLIPVVLLSAFPHRLFHTLPGLLDSRAALSNSYPNACVPRGRQFVPFLWWPLVWPANQRPTAWQGNNLTTKPTWHGRCLR